jgi:hypothetical protein
LPQSEQVTFVISRGPESLGPPKFLEPPKLFDPNIVLLIQSKTVPLYTLLQHKNLSIAAGLITKIKELSSADIMKNRATDRFISNNSCLITKRKDHQIAQSNRSDIIKGAIQTDLHVLKGLDFYIIELKAELHCY